ncbi:response regulator [Pseudooceanicola aestuarii]|uniref:response regulator n=1 Tax=Pseudooceanicola aestuarii TaxID=2697319 RepID=UPI0013D87210|nr:response regulator [Pseudooceanicola aestuarii]
MDLFATRPGPTTDRPLLGLTILVVEDSRFAAEAMRLMCLRSGARIRRADCLRSARRHLQTYRSQVLIVDLGLPDGSGLDLLVDLAPSPARPHAVIAISGDPAGRVPALRAGADAFMAKPVAGLAEFQRQVLRLLPVEWQTPLPTPGSLSPVHPDPLALREDMERAAAMLPDADRRTLGYLCRFLEGVAVSSGDAPLVDAVRRIRNGPDSGAARNIAGLNRILEDRLATQPLI